MKKAALIIAKNLFRDEEYFQPKDILERKGILVSTISSSKGPCTGKLGAKAFAGISLEELNTADFDGIFFIGGPGSTDFFDDPIAHKILNETVRLGKVAGSICAASTTLARSGILKGKKATGFSSTEPDIRANGAIWTGNHVEIDGKIITADGPESATSFGELIADTLLQNG